jgi:hypothetical protein
MGRMSLDQIAKSIEARIAELRDDMAALEAARSALQDGLTGTSAAPAARVARPRRARTAKRTRSTNGAANVVKVSEPVSDGKPARNAKSGSDAKPARNGRRARRTATASNGAGASPQATPKVSTGSADQTSKRRVRAKAAPRKSRTQGAALGAGELQAMLGEAGEGLSAITISKRFSAGYNRVLGLLRELEAAGQIRRTGSRRTSLWRLITDEERIAERAAELEKRAVAKS